MTKRWRAPKNRTPDITTAANKKGEPEFAFLLRCLAERTGLEPATPGVTGRYSNQLNYRSMRFAACAASLAMFSRIQSALACVQADARLRGSTEVHLKLWWVLRGSNSRPTPCKGAALPTELSTQLHADDRRKPAENCCGTATSAALPHQAASPLV
ncbi:hypothetical protein PT2222_310063 [Paraburkholderia tropica]